MKLLVLDLDETVIFSVEQPLGHKHDFIVGDYFVYKRPGLEEFLWSVSEHFMIAVWTSATSSYAEAVISNAFPRNMEISFVWSRSRCTPKYFSELYETRMYEPEWIKNLKKIKRKGFSLDDIIMVDDTPAALTKNYGNLVRVRPFMGDPKDCELLLLKQYLPDLAQLPSVRTIEKRYWRKSTLVLSDL